MKTFDQLSIIGLREWIAFPELGMVGLRVRIGTGASTSSLYASGIIPLERDDEKWVRFTAHLGTLIRRRHRCKAPMVTRKTIRGSNSQTQIRYVIRTTLALGDRMWPMELTLACRKSMRYRVLLGSKALIAGQLVVSPALAYAQNHPESPAALLTAMDISLLDRSPVWAIRRQHLSNLHPFPKRPVQCLPRRQPTTPPPLPANRSNPSTGAE